MGSILDTPHTEKKTDAGTGNDLKYSVCSMQGWRVEMEDAHCAKVGLPGLPDWSFFAVFDGHAGAYVSAHCAENLLNTILQTDSFLKYAVAASKLSKTKNGNSTNGESENTEAASSSTKNEDNKNENDNLQCDQQLAEAFGDEHLDCDQMLERIKSSIRDAFLKLDERMKEVISDEDMSGSTAVACLVSPTHLFFANCGDSRAVLSKGGKAVFSTQDHKPVNPLEKERIQAAGGSVMIQRVNGSLAVSRALGDYQYKQVAGRGPCEQLVSPEPEITIYKRDMVADEFLILACDGIWDVMNNDELCAFVHHQLLIHSNLEDVCSSIIDTCLHKGSTDNMSIVLVTFPAAPTFSEQHKLLDDQLNKKIEERVIYLLEQNADFTSIYLLMQSLKNEHFDNLPPGGGLDSKRTLIEETQKRYAKEHRDD